MRLVWATDLHMSHINDTLTWPKFIRKVREYSPSGLVISGDIGQGDCLAVQLEVLHNSFHDIPIYFVLGNHDFYHRSIDKCRKITRDSCLKFDNLHYLSESPVITLDRNIALIGHDGWADGKNAEVSSVKNEMNDFVLIDDLRTTNRFNVMSKMAKEAEDFLVMQLTKALTRHYKVLLVTHVPPFARAAWHKGGMGDPNFRPFFANSIGDKLCEIMNEYEDKSLVILCGHTHSGGVYRPTENVWVMTGKATYGEPDISDIIYNSWVGDRFDIGVGEAVALDSPS